MANWSNLCGIGFQPRIFVLFVLLGLVLVDNCVCPRSPYRGFNEPEGLKYLFLKLTDPYADPDQMLEMGDRLRNMQRYEDAKKFYRKSIKRYVYRAKDNVTSNDVDDVRKALTDYEKVVTVEQHLSQDENKLYEPNEVSSTIAELGRILFDKELFKDSLRCFEIAITMHPENPAPLSKRGLCYWKSGDTDAALADLMKSLELGPSYTDGRAEWYRVLKEAGKIDVAEAVFANIQPAQRRALMEAEEKEVFRKTEEEESYEELRHGYRSSPKRKDRKDRYNPYKRSRL